MKPLRTAFRLWLCTLLLTLTAGCWQDEEFSTAPTDLLRFSTDSVNFDTVISGQPTNTRTFMVYNPNARSLRISRAFLGRGTESVFRVNIDGTFLENGEASNFELYAEDSLRVFLEMTAPVSDSDEPVAVEDELTFVLESGQTQSVTLTAYGQDVVVLKGWTVTADTTLTARRPYQVYDSLVVAPDVTLSLPAGARLYFHPDARLIVHGTLRAEGALGNEVMMRGDRMGNMFSNQPYDLIPGQWGGIVLTSGSYGNIFKYCDIHSGSFGLRCDSADVSREKVRIENSVLHNVSGDVLTARACSLFVGNSQLTNAGGNCVTLYGGSSRFVHCTIANFYAFTGGRGVALSYTNADGSIPYPLHQALLLRRGPLVGPNDGAAQDLSPAVEKHRAHHMAAEADAHNIRRRNLGRQGLGGPADGSIPVVGVLLRPVAVVVPARIRLHDGSHQSAVGGEQRGLVAGCAQIVGQDVLHRDSSSFHHTENR